MVVSAFPAWRTRRVAAAGGALGRADLIGNSKRHLVPAYQPLGTGKKPEGARRPDKYQKFRTQQTGLPPGPVTVDKKIRRSVRPAARSSRAGR